MKSLIKKILREELYSNPKIIYGDDSVTFGFSSMKLGKPDAKQKVFFNNLRILDGEYLRGENSQITLKGNGLTIDIPPQEFYIISKYNSGSVDLDILRKINPSIVDLLFNKPEGEVTSSLIRSALKTAFQPYWKESDTLFTAGLRGIHTIGEKTGKGETWSIMNFFDTKKEVQKEIEQTWKIEGKGKDLLDWLIETFKNNKGFLEKLLEIQWRSIKNGYETELYVSQKLSDNVGGRAEFFPPGSIMDRYHSIDMIIDGKTYQIKPLKGITELISKTGQKYYVVKTYGMIDYTQKKIDYIVYGEKDGEVYVFPNKNYDVRNTGEVLHSESPIRI